MIARVSRVAIVGAGLVGSGWTIVHARAGKSVTVYDPAPSVRASFYGSIAAALEQMQADDPIEREDILRRITVVDSLGDAVADADFIQESVLEQVDVKTDVSAQIDALARPDAVVGSSSSGIPASAFTEKCTGRARFLIVHPVNPPHLVPVVELVPAPWTSPEVVEIASALMTEVGQIPVLVRREIEGFILNRLQGALLNEAWALYEEGYASAADIDKTVSHGLGLRWCFVGPFEAIDLNAPGGVDDYARRLGPLYARIAHSRSQPRPWSNSLIAEITRERRAALPLEDLEQRRLWRDAYLSRLAAFKKKQDGAA
jgi:L-gulonate 3-dehydrogenase